MSALETALKRFTASDWQQVLDAIEPAIHPIDRNATRIWFSFFPLGLHVRLEQARAEGPESEANLVRRMRLMGRWRLADQVDSSHRFLYAHRYWPQVRTAILGLEEATDPQASLATIVQAVGEAAARTARVDPEMLLGMSAVGLMTLRQAGSEALAAAPGQIHLSDPARAMSPQQVLKRRARDDWQGPLGFLRGIKKRWTVTFDEADREARFQAINGQEIATAAQADKRD